MGLSTLQNYKKPFISTYELPIHLMGKKQQLAWIRSVQTTNHSALLRMFRSSGLGFLCSMQAANDD